MGAVRVGRARRVHAGDVRPEVGVDGTDPPGDGRVQVVLPDLLADRPGAAARRERRRPARARGALGGGIVEGGGGEGDVRAHEPERLRVVALVVEDPPGHPDREVAGAAAVEHGRRRSDREDRARLLSAELVHRVDRVVRDRGVRRDREPVHLRVLPRLIVAEHVGDLGVELEVTVEADRNARDDGVPHARVPELVDLHHLAERRVRGRIALLARDLPLLLLPVPAERDTQVEGVVRLGARDGGDLRGSRGGCERGERAGEDGAQAKPPHGSSGRAEPRENAGKDRGDGSSAPTEGSRKRGPARVHAYARLWEVHGELRRRPGRPRPSDPAPSSSPGATSG